jgi:hypothetical protein
MVDVFRTQFVPGRVTQGSQRFTNGEIHQWYRLVWGYPDHLVQSLIEGFDLPTGAHLLDPFSGSGTTLVEGLKLGLRCTGVDANPVAVLAARVKTNWFLKPEVLLRLIPRVLRSYDRRIRSGESTENDPAYQYIVRSGMVDRGWISRENLRRGIALKCAIRAIETTAQYRDALSLALLTAVVRDLANVRFGPELYCGAARRDTDAAEAWSNRVETMIRDLALVQGYKNRGRVIKGDARNLTNLLRREHTGQAHAVICSPPYPAEHDYTRNTRLELAFLECVTDLDSLRAVKREMIRSHTKNIYVGDHDSRWIKNLPAVNQIAQKVADGARGRSHGFARYYETVILEYFGGMARHFRSLRGVLRTGAPCAYVVGEQASYGSVHVPTVELLALVAEQAGLRVEAVQAWRSRKSTTTSVSIAEAVLFLRNGKPA